MHKALIRDQANALFSKISVAKTSVADIAKACGLGKGTIYLYFKSKDEIILAIIEDRLERLDLEKAPYYGAPGRPLEEKIRSFFLDFVDESFGLKKLIFGEFENVQGRMFKDIFVRYGRFYEWCVDRLLEIVRAHPPYDERPPERLREDLNLLIELMMGRMILFLIGRDWDDQEGIKAVIGPLSNRLFEALIA